MKTVATFLMVLLTVLSTDNAAAYQKAVEGKDVVKNKLFPKDGNVEIEGPYLGTVLNSSYVNTFLVGGGINYFFSETWGIGVEGAIAFNSDRAERECIENFYNDPNQAVAAECGPEESLLEDTEGDANFGPAYVPIRELNSMFGVNALWNPIYGKQILLLSGTSYFDVFVRLGGGIVLSSFYPKQPELRLSGNTARGSFCTKRGAREGECTQDLNPGTGDPNEVGTDGRPDPVASNNVMINFGIGQKYHFFKRFHFKLELRNFTLLATEQGFDNFFTLSGGIGVRF